MFVKIFLTAILAVASAQEILDKSDVDILRKMIDEGRNAVAVMEFNIQSSPKKFDSYIKDRYDCLNWEVVVQKQNLNKTIAEAVIQGMVKNKQYNNFQCISKAAQETEIKLDAISSQIHNNSESIKEKELSGVMAFGSIGKGFHNYLNDLFKKKSEELAKTSNEETRRKIVEEVGKKIKHLNSVLERVNSFVKDALFKFFEKYVDYAFKTEKSLRSTCKDGSNAIMRCVF